MKKKGNTDEDLLVFSCKSHTTLASAENHWKGPYLSCLDDKIINQQDQRLVLHTAQDTRECENRLQLILNHKHTVSAVIVCRVLKKRVLRLLMMLSRLNNEIMLGHVWFALV